MRLPTLVVPKPVFMFEAACRVVGERVRGLSHWSSKPGYDGMDSSEYDIRCLLVPGLTLGYYMNTC